MSQSISRNYGAIEIINPSQEQSLQSVIHNNSLSIAVPDRTPVVPLCNFTNDEDVVDLSQECRVIPKDEPKVEVTTVVDLDYASDDESVTEDNTVNEDQFADELIPLGSTTNAQGLRCSTRTYRPPQVSKLSFRNK